MANGNGNGDEQGHESDDAAHGGHEDAGPNGHYHVDDLARLIDGLKIPPQAASMSARAASASDGCASRRRERRRDNRQAPSAHGPR